MDIGRRTALQVGLIGAAAGLYNIISGQEAGQVWERSEGGGDPVRRPELEAASRVELSALAATTAPALVSLVDNLTPRDPATSGTGTAVAAALAAGAGKLGRGVYDVSASLQLRDGAPLEGLGRQLTKLYGMPALPAGSAIVSTVRTEAADARRYAQAGQVLRGLEIGSDTKNLVGLRVEGAYRTVEDVTVRELPGGTGIQFGTRNTYCNTLRDGEVWGCAVGIHYPANIDDSGERITIENYTVFNNTYNLYVEAEGWFLKFNNCSFDYAGTAQIITKGNRVDMHFNQCHFEGRAGVPLIQSVQENAADLGLVHLRSCTSHRTMNSRAGREIPRFS